MGAQPRDRRRAGRGRLRLPFVLLTVLLLGAGACSSGSTGSGAPLRGTTVVLVAGWSGVEQARFERVLRRFTADTGARVRYVSAAGEYLPDRLDAMIARGRPPDVTLLSEPGILRSYASAHRVVPLDAATRAIVDDHYAAGWRALASVAGREYGVWFKAANKSLVWYDVAALERVGRAPPTTLLGFAGLVDTLRRDGIVPFSVGGADGWVLTDWFENLYVRLAGPARYDALAAHRLPWTDPSVATALRWMRRLVAPANLLGGTAGALRTSFPRSVALAFGPPARAAMVMEGDFVGGFLAHGTGEPAGTVVDVFPFPGGYRGLPLVVGGGDMAVAMTRSPGAAALLRFLASPEAAAIWAARGGFVSPNVDLDLSTYPDPVTRAVARNLVEAGGGFRFDLSDLQPPAFGSQPHGGMQGALERFLRDGDVAAAQQRLERDARAVTG